MEKYNKLLEQQNNAKRKSVSYGIEGKEPSK